MAYFSQEDKRRVSPAIKSVLKKYNVKGTIGVKNNSTLVVNIMKGSLDFSSADVKIQEFNKKFNQRETTVKRDYIQVNPYCASNSHNEVGETVIANFFTELVTAMKTAAWYNKSDSRVDYFDTAYYLNINVGTWNKRYELV